MDARRLDDQYLTHLYSLVETEGRPPQWRLMQHLYSVEFYHFIPNDDNRAADGMDLRKEFIRVMNVSAPSEWMTLGCSVLEMLIALARRLQYQYVEHYTVGDCFWMLLDNLGLSESWDDDPIDSDTIQQTLDRLIGREYETNGEGGLFPLHNPSRDQRSVELIYQMYAYVLEQE